MVLDGNDGASATPINARQISSITKDPDAVANNVWEAKPIRKVNTLHRMIALPYNLRGPTRSSR
ncbi:hypothetical protein D3C87_1872700 [compost metagenome]